MNIRLTNDEGATLALVAAKLRGLADLLVRMDEARRPVPDHEVLAVSDALEESGMTVYAVWDAATDRVFAEHDAARAASVG